MSVDFDVVDALAGFAEDLHGEGNFAMRLHDAVKRLKEERDEARAEVERLRQAVHTRACRNQSAYDLNCVCGADEHQRDLQKLAYRRGAEAMREAAMGAAWHSAAMALYKKIQEMPVPEDKP